MASSDSPTKEGGHDKAIGVERKRGKGKRRHIFTMEELLLLNNKFSENPYPDFTTRKELSNLIHCSISIIDNWFQNKRARLPAKERCRIFAARKQKEFPVEGHSLLSLQYTKYEAPNYVPEHSFSYTQETLPGRAGCSSLYTQGVFSQQVGLDHTGVPKIEKEQGYVLEYQSNTGNGLFPGSLCSNYRSTTGLHPPTSPVDYFDKTRTEGGEKQHANPYILHCVYTMHGRRQQQEEQKNRPYSLLQGWQQNGSQYHLQQPQQPQNCQEKMRFQEQLLMYPSHEDLGQQFPYLQSQEQGWDPQKNGESLCSQLQQASPK
ncbi:cytoplasmic polyadenylated homeobox-like [Orycteropus afer afer]|uniref:Cytoplasmic polyadenylated homeobox-like n=1 Tax=Orycteropus afer afer TaxID=1230840 RepID=A0AC54Z6X8_ORYAF|nr:cytoplasmic polyadenylated homeobox-like [Orycteropus afer afer]